MTTKEQIIRRVLDMDDAQAERLWDQIESGNGAGNRASGRHGTADLEDVFAGRRERDRIALATPPDQRTPFQKLTVDRLAWEAAHAGTPEAEATRRDLERIANAPPFTLDDPLWELAGMIKRKPGEPLTNIAENHDEYLAEAYTDLHEDDPL